MFIKALRSNYGDYGSVRRGQIIEVKDPAAQQLIKRGLFEGVKHDAKEGDGPLSRSGGRSGKGKRSSSSQPVPVPETSTSNSCGGEGE